ncbi:anti-repressor SinI family protein [Siminovitchia fortis]|nr:anti-repressor SinI family protein [Siminovitchia fortis]WHY81503.1 anti-repressor SinI family protein [Siminovitchia fortis]
MALDQEWVELIMLAKHMGLTLEEVREFLRTTGRRPGISMPG